MQAYGLLLVMIIKYFFRLMKQEGVNKQNWRVQNVAFSIY